MLTPMADRLGRAYRPGRHYEVADREAARLIEGGAARAATNELGRAMATLAARGAGVVVGEETDAELVQAAKNAGVRVQRRAGRPRRHG